MPAGDVELINTASPKNSGSFPVVRAGDILGGFRSVANAVARDAIPAPRREQGMRVRTNDDGNEWVLEADLVTWTPVPIGGDHVYTCHDWVDAENGVDHAGPSSFGSPYKTLSYTVSTWSQPTSPAEFERSRVVHLMGGFDYTEGGGVLVIPWTGRLEIEAPGCALPPIRWEIDDQYVFPGNSDPQIVLRGSSSWYMGNWTRIKPSPGSLFLGDGQQAFHIANVGLNPTAAEVVFDNADVWGDITISGLFNTGCVFFDLHRSTFMHGGPPALGFIGDIAAPEKHIVAAEECWFPGQSGPYSLRADMFYLMRHCYFDVDVVSNSASIPGFTLWSDCHFFMAATYTGPLGSLVCDGVTNALIKMYCPGGIPGPAKTVLCDPLA